MDLHNPYIRKIDKYLRSWKQCTHCQDHGNEGKGNNNDLPTTNSFVSKQHSSVQNDYNNYVLGLHLHCDLPNLNQNGTKLNQNSTQYF